MPPDSLESFDSGGPMRVLQILRGVSAAGGGVQTYLASLIGAVSRDAVELKLGALDHGTRPAFDCDLQHIGPGATGSLRNMRAFLQWFSRASADTDLVHIHRVFGAQLPLAAGWCWARNIPFVVSPHGRLMQVAIAEMDWRLRLYLRVVILPLLRRAAGIVVTTPLEAAGVRALLPDHPGIAIVPPAVEVPSAAAPAPADHVLQIVFVGRLAPVKNVPTLIEATAKMLKAGTAVELHLIGTADVEYGDSLAALCHRLDIQEQVRFHGYLQGTALSERVASCHVLALPSRRENFSFAVAEALSAGVPVAVSSAVGLAPLIEQYACGVVVPDTTASRWAQVLPGFASPESRVAMSAAAKCCARTEFTLEAMRKALLQCYREAHHRPPQGRKRASQV